MIVVLGQNSSISILLGHFKLFINIYMLCKVISANTISYILYVTIII